MPNFAARPCAGPRPVGNCVASRWPSRSPPPCRHLHCPRRQTYLLGQKRAGGMRRTCSSVLRCTALCYGRLFERQRKKPANCRPDKRQRRESAASVPAESLQNPRHSQTGEGRTVMPVPAQDLNRMIQPSWQNRTIFDNVIFSSTKSYYFGVAKRKNITFPSFHIKFSHCLIHASNAN